DPADIHQMGVGRYLIVSADRIDDQSEHQPDERVDERRAEEPGGEAFHADTSGIVTMPGIQPEGAGEVAIAMAGGARARGPYEPPPLCVCACAAAEAARGLLGRPTTTSPAPAIRSMPAMVGGSGTSANKRKLQTAAKAR